MMHLAVDAHGMPLCEALTAGAVQATKLGDGRKTGAVLADTAYGAGHRPEQLGQSGA